MGVAASFRMGMVSAGGYHHHIGYNTWQGEDAPPPPANAVGLLRYTLNLPNAEELERLDGVLQQHGPPSSATPMAYSCAIHRKTPCLSPPPN
jgi:catechol-2,3-dioxygenase